MQIPLLLQIAIDRELGIFYHDQVRMTLPPGASVTLDYSPPNIDAIWLNFAMTLGNMKENTFLITHACSRGMKTHLDPTWYSIGIGAAFVYPLWIYVSRETPHTFNIVNNSAVAETGDICFWFVEFRGAKFDKFQEMIEGLYNLIRWFKDDPSALNLARNIELLLYLQLKPELKPSILRKYETEIEEELDRLRIRRRRR